MYINPRFVFKKVWMLLCFNISLIIMKNIYNRNTNEKCFYNFSWNILLAFGIFMHTQNQHENKFHVIFIHEKCECIFPGDDENNPKRIW